MTAAQSPASSPAPAAAGAGAPRQGPSVGQGGLPAGAGGSDRSPSKRLRTGPSNWLLAPALSFFGVFALLPLLGVVVLSFFAWDGLGTPQFAGLSAWIQVFQEPDRKSTRLNSSHVASSYAVFFLKNNKIM